MYNDTVQFEIVRRCGAIGKEKNGWIRELNVVSWNGADPKYDVRSWNEDHSRMTRGITLSYEEAVCLAAVLRAAI